MKRKPPKLASFAGEEVLTKPEYVIGRHADCDICFPNDRSMSRYHATIFREGFSYKIKDGTIGRLKGGKIPSGKLSRYGVYVNDEKLSPLESWRRELRHGDRIRLGQTELVYLDQPETKENDETKQTYTGESSEDS